MQTLLPLSDGHIIRVHAIHNRSQSGLTAMARVKYLLTLHFDAEPFAFDNHLANCTSGDGNPGNSANYARADIVDCMHVQIPAKENMSRSREKLGGF